MTAIIEHRDMVMWKGADGRWVVRSTAAAPAGVVYRSGARSSGAERIRRRLWGAAAKQKDAVDQAAIDRAVARGHRTKLRAPTAPPVNETKAAQLDFVRRLRARHGLERPSAAAVAYDCAHRMRRW